MKLKTIIIALAAVAWPAAAQPVVTFDPSAGELPVSVAVDKVGNKWVALQPICQVRRYTPDWQESLRLTLVSDCSGGAGTSGLAVDATGALYAAIIGPEAIRGVYEVDPSGALQRLPGTEQMVAPNALAFDHNNGTLYVTDMPGGAVWRIPRGGSAEIWSQDPLLAGIPIPGLGVPGGANGIAVFQNEVIVSVCFFARIVKIPIQPDGSAGAIQVLYSTPAMMAAGIFGVDDIALDVFGNIYASVIAAGPGVARLAPDGSGITRLTALAAATVSVAFGTGMGERQSIFAAINPAFGGSGSAVIAVDAGVPGRPLP